MQAHSTLCLAPSSSCTRIGSRVQRAAQLRMCSGAVVVIASTGISVLSGRDVPEHAWGMLLRSCGTDTRSSSGMWYAALSVNTGSYESSRPPMHSMMPHEDAWTWGWGRAVVGVQLPHFGLQMQMQMPEWQLTGLGHGGMKRGCTVRD